MWSQFPTWFIFAALLLGSGCIATVLFLARDAERRLLGFGAGSDQKLQEHDQAFGQLETRVEDMAGRLFNAATERRDLSRSNQKLSADVEAWAGELKTARGSLTAQEGELSRLREQHREVSERIRAQRTTLEDKQKTIAELEADLLGKTRQLEALDRQHGEFAEHHKRDRDEVQQRAQRLAEAQGILSARVAELETTLLVRDRALQESEAEAKVTAQSRQELANRVQSQAEELLAHERRALESETTSSALVRELERRLARNEQESHERAAAIESLERQLTQRDQESRERAVEARERTATIESLGRDLAQSEQESHERAAAIESLRQDLAQRDQESRERAAESREREATIESLVRDLAQSEHESHERAATIESLERAATERNLRVDALQARCREIEDLSRSRSATLDALSVELESLRREASLSQERELTWSARVADLEVELARHETAWHERSATLEALQLDVASQVRELGAARERCQELERQVDLDHELARGALEAHTVLSLRVTELEGDLATREDLDRERSASIERLEADLAARSREAESAEDRCRELHAELHRLRDEEEERRTMQLETAAAHGERVRELESTLDERDGELELLRIERTLLSARCAAVSHALEAGTDELHDRDQRLAEAEERCRAAKLEVECCLEASELERAPIDPLVEGRILHLFKRGGVTATELLPDGYLSGLDQGDLDLALRSLFGGVEPLSAPAMTSLASRWRKEQSVWKQAPFTQQAVYLWADGVFVKAGLGDETQSLLVVFAAFVDGTRSVVAVEPGHRESKDDWLTVLRSLERRGLGIPRLVVADESLGILDALDELGWNSARQRCWSRRIDEVVALVPKNRQGWAAEKLRRLTSADSRAEAKDLRDEFVKRCGVRNAAAAERLCADWRQMTSYFSFPKSHWSHLRTTNVVESPFAAIRLRSGAPRAGVPTPDAESMLWKLVVVGENTHRKLNSPLLLPGVARGDVFVDGLPDEKTRGRAA